MCFTGGFALGMMVDERMLAPVLSQPSLPARPDRSATSRELGVSDDDLARVKERAAAGTRVLGLRFTGDRLRARRALRARCARSWAMPSSASRSTRRRATPWGIPKIAHSVLTEHLVDEPGHPTHDALDQVLDFFRDAAGRARLTVSSPGRGAS